MGVHDGVLLAQQTAANLGVSVGDRVSIGRPGQSPLVVGIDGIVRPPSRRPDVPIDRRGTRKHGHRSAGQRGPAAVRDAGPAFANAAGGTTSTQLYTQLSHDLPADPGSAFAQVAGRAKNLEAGAGRRRARREHLAAQLDGTRSDAIYAEMLFLFLGLPGVIIAALPAGVIASSGRSGAGASSRCCACAVPIPPGSAAGLAAAEAALLTGIVGTAIGLLAAAVVGRIAFGHVDGSARPRRRPSRGASRPWCSAWRSPPSRSSRHLYPLDMSVEDKIRTIVQEIYGADGVDFSVPALKRLAEIEKNGWSGMPVCMAKTQYSFSDDASRLGPPRASPSMSGT